MDLTEYAAMMEDRGKVSFIKEEDRYGLIRQKIEYINKSDKPIEEASRDFDDHLFDRRK